MRRLANTIISIVRGIEYCAPALGVAHPQAMRKRGRRRSERFESELPAQKARFTKRMHVYMGQSGEEVDKVYYIAGQKIKVTR